MRRKGWANQPLRGHHGAITIAADYSCPIPWRYRATHEKGGKRYTRTDPKGGIGPRDLSRLRLVTDCKSESPWCTGSFANKSMTGVPQRRKQPGGDVPVQGPLD